MAWQAIAGTTWGTSPTIGTAFYFDMQRSGADMQYRVRIEMAPLRVGGASWFGYPIYFSVYVNGGAIAEGGTLKPASPPQWDYTLAWESGWTTVPGKVSGTTPLSIRLYSGSGSTRDQWYGYELPIINAGTTLRFGTLTIGQAATITATRYNAAYRYTITYSLGSASGTVVEDSTDASISWTPPAELLIQIPASVSASGTLRVDTYDGATLIGSIDYIATFAVASDVVPVIDSVSITPATSSAWVQATGAYVQGYTAVRVGTSATPGSGASIASITITGDAGSGTGADWTSAVLSSIGDKQIIVTVTDSRGRAASAAYTISVLAYNPPTISNVLFERGTYAHGTWTASETGTDLKISYSISLSLIAQGNNAAAEISIGGAQRWSGTITSSGAQTTYITGVSPDATQTMIISAVDLVGGSTSITTVIPTAKVLINKNFALNSIRFGGVAEKPDTMQVDLDLSLGSPLGIASGGTEGNTPDAARANLLAMARPKLLWSGAWASGSILLPELADYEMFVLVINSSLYPLPMLMVKSPNSTGNPIIWTGSGALDANVPAQQQRSFGVELQCNTTGYVYASQKNTMVHIGGGAHVGPSADPWDILRLYGLVLTSDLAQEDT